MQLPKKMVGRTILAQKLSVTQSEGGIHLTSIGDEKIAKVLMLGSGYKDGVHVDFEVAVGDVVVYTRQIPLELPGGQGAFLVLDEGHITAVVG